MNTIDKTGSSSTSGPRCEATKFKNQSKKYKEAARKKAKKQQDADLLYIGSQFQQDNQAQQSSTADYPKVINLD